MDESGDAFVALEDIGEKRDGLLGEHWLHFAVVIKAKRPALFRRHFTKLIEPQPGGGEVLHKCLGLGIA